jgi:acyl-CoA hydrolase
MEQRRAGTEVHLDEWVSPHICDPEGTLKPGKILEWMDVVGVLAATRHCRRPVVTASVDGVELRDPIRVGEHVALRAAVAYTSDRSMGVRAAMSSSGPDALPAREVLVAYMTFVGLDEAGKAAPVPQLRPETPAERAHFREGQLRREFRRKLEQGELSGDALPSEAFRGLTEQERPLLVRELLKMFPRSFLLPWERDPGPPQSPHNSYVHTIEPVHVSDMNFHGTLYGGKLMRWLETNAHLSARAYVGGKPVQMVGLHGLTFIRPVQRHVFVHIRSVVVHAEPHTLTVLVSVEAEDPIGGEYADTLRAFLTYAPWESSVRVPPLQCASAEERALFNEVTHRLALQRTLRGQG